MELSRRLQAVADLVTCGNTVADIGCDHGYISIYLIEQKKSPHVIAMDVNAGPLKKAQEHIERQELQAKIEIRQSDGLHKLKQKEVDSLLIAGMGGKLMIRILDEGKSLLSDIKEIILQPQSEIHLVRQYLRSIGFLIVEENMVLEENKYYFLMRAVPAGSTVEVAEEREQSIFDQYGKHLLFNKNELLYSFLKYREQCVEKIMRELSEEGVINTRREQRIFELKTEKEEIEYALQFYQNS